MGEIGLSYVTSVIPSGDVVHDESVILLNLVGERVGRGSVGGGRDSSAAEQRDDGRRLCP